MFLRKFFIHNFTLNRRPQRSHLNVAVLPSLHTKRAKKPQNGQSRLSIVTCAPSKTGK